ncbi:MAG: hypothetical protein K2M17_03410 [Bacilli bacterium]|nr:hypothetical protein [Bacilli bacterium]
MIKISLLPFFDDVESYLYLCLLGSFGLLFYNVIMLHWTINRQNLRKIKKFPAEYNYTLIAIKSTLWFSFITIFAALWIYFWWIWEDKAEVLIYICISVIMSLMTVVFNLMNLIRFDRIKVAAMRSLHSLQADIPPIILLRSFELDKYPWWNNKTFDEELCGNININECPILSLSDPDQILPTGGSLKIQSKDEYWKKIINELLQNCRAVVIVEGESEGLSWEIERIREIYEHHPDKVFIYVPSNKYRTLAWCVDNTNGGKGIMRNFTVFMIKISSPRFIKKQLRACWERFSRFLEEKGFNIPDDNHGSEFLIAYDNQKNPIVIKKKNGEDLFDVIMKRTQKYQQSLFDYSEISRRIAAYEVNGFMTQLQVMEFAGVVSRIKKIDYFVMAFIFLIGILGWFC